MPSPMAIKKETVLEATLPTSTAADKASSSCKVNLVSCFLPSRLETATEMVFFFQYYSMSTATFHATSDMGWSTEQSHVLILCSSEMLYGNHASTKQSLNHI